ncbi:MAG: 6-bladed beta-propeller, partial [Tannerellaceae bacterium]
MTSMIGTMVFTACTSVNKQTIIEQTAVVDLLNPVEVPLSKVVSQISIVPLETTGASLLHEFNPSSLWVGDETILVASNGLMQFDRTGKFIKKLIVKGEGPNEVPFTGD